jgi:threonine dehydrogenase-like Zn-dependent dehydrogenase
VKALVYAGKESIRYEQVPDPAIQEPTDAIMKVSMTAICGSDLHIYHHREKGLDIGTAMGHESVGEIVEIGKNVKSLRKGEQVISPFTSNCGECFYCRSGLTSRCERGNLFGWVESGNGLQGMQAEYVRIPFADSTLLAMPEDVSAGNGLLVGDILSTGYFCAEMGGIKQETVCAVIGCGPVGIMAIAAAKHLGAGEIYCVDSVADRLKLGENFGAHAINYESEETLQVIRDRTDGRGVDAVLEVVGNPAAMRMAVDIVRPGGVVASVGVHTNLLFSFSPAEAYDKNLTFRTGRCPARHYMERLMPLLRNKDIPLSSVISHRLALSEGVGAYEMFDKKLDGCTKVILTP